MIIAPFCDNVIYTVLFLRRPTLKNRIWGNSIYIFGATGICMAPITLVYFTIDNIKKFAILKNGIGIKGQKSMQTS